MTDKDKNKDKSKDTGSSIKDVEDDRRGKQILRDSSLRSE